MEYQVHAHMCWSCNRCFQHAVPCGRVLVLTGVSAAVPAVVQVLASVDGAPMMQAPGPSTLITPQGQTLKLPADWKDKEIKESMQSHFD